MSVESVRGVIDRPSPEALVVVGLILFAQLALLGLYLSTVGPDLMAFHLYPIVWITVSAWVLWHARPAPASRDRHLLAGGIAILYFLLLAWLGGLFSIETFLNTADAAFAGGLRVEASVPPGYAPTLFYVGSNVTIALIPYLFIGYVTLAYLVYVTILDAWAASAPGLLGIFGCIGCSWPIFAALFAGAGGAMGSITAAVYANAYPISTVAFLIAVTLLYWRPSYGTLHRWRR